MVSEIIAFILLSAATVAASAIITGYLASATSQTTARINAQGAEQVARLSESLTIVTSYTCGSQLCVDVMNNSGRDIGILYAYNGNGDAVPFSIVNQSNAVVAKLPVGRSTIALTPNTITSATLISENYLVYRVN